MDDHELSSWYPAKRYCYSAVEPSLGGSRLQYGLEILIRVIEHDDSKEICIQPGCIKNATCGIMGYDPLTCSEHQLDEYVNLKNKMCEYPGCTILPSYGYLGQENAPVLHTNSKDTSVLTRDVIS